MGSFSSCRPCLSIHVVVVKGGIHVASLESRIVIQWMVVSSCSILCCNLDPIVFWCISWPTTLYGDSNHIWRTLEIAFSNS